MGYVADKKKRRPQAESSSAARGIKGGFAGLAAAGVCSVLLWVGASLAAYSNSDPDSVLSVFALCAVYISAAVGGFVSGKYNKEGALVSSLVCGGLMVALMFLISVPFGEEYSSGYGALIALILRAAIVFMALLGGYMGSHQKKRRKRRR